MKRTILILVALALLLGTGGQAKAGIIYDNLPTDTYQPASGPTVSGPTSPVGGPFSHSESFVAGMSANLGSVELAMWHAGGTTGFTLTLTDSGANVLESWHANAAPISSATPVVQVLSLSHPFLLLGQTYNLSSVADSSTWDAWEFSSDTFIPGKSGFRVDSSGTTAVPEPATMTMLGIGIAGLAGYGWRRRKQQATIA